MDLARELKKKKKTTKKLWNMKATVIPIVDTLGTVSRSLEKRPDESKTRIIETIQIIALLISARALRRIKEI